MDKIADCPVLTTLELISGKWKTRTLWLLRDAPHSFGALKRGLRGISSKVLTEQLQQLERDGLIDRQEGFQGGVRVVVYTYSDYGRTLIPALDALGAWGRRHQLGLN